MAAATASHLAAPILMDRILSPPPFPLFDRGRYTMMGGGAVLSRQRLRHASRPPFSVPSTWRPGRRLPGRPGRLAASGGWPAQPAAPSSRDRQPRSCAHAADGGLRRVWLAGRKERGGKNTDGPFPLDWPCATSFFSARIRPLGDVTLLWSANALCAGVWRVSIKTARLAGRRPPPATVALKTARAVEAAAAAVGAVGVVSSGCRGVCGQLRRRPRRRRRPRSTMGGRPPRGPAAAAAALH